MRGRLLVPVMGLGLVFSVMGSVPANAASKKRPDLVVSSVAASPAKVAAGGVLTVKDTTANRGRKAAPRSVTRYVLSKDKKLNRGDVRLRDRAVRALKPRKKQATKALKVRVPATTKPGTYWLLACADARKKVKESNERNNCRAVRKRVTITKAPFAWPKTGAVKVNITARVDVTYRLRANSVGFKTVEDSDVRLNGKAQGWLMFKNGKPDLLTWVWSSATASGTELWDAEGQTDTPCRWDAYAKFSRSGAINVRPGGIHTAGAIDFPGSASGPGASFGLNQDLGSQVTPRINCHGENIGNVSPVPTVELKSYWWFKKPTYTINWARDFSKVTWREFGVNNYTSPSTGAFENQSYQADGALTLTPVR